MRPKSIGLIGTGSLRCGLPVLSTIAAMGLARPLELRLFDANEERLDLMVRLAEQVLALAGTEHDVLCTSIVEEALEDVDAAVVSLSEDCARRMTGKTAARVLLPVEPEDGTELYDLGGGDMNSPTPLEELGPRTLAALSTPDVGRVTREEAIKAALEVVYRHVGDAKVLNLTRCAEASKLPAHTVLNWPEPLSKEERRSMPHQILRWLNGDEGLDQYVKEFAGSPLANWLKSELRVR
ncbi:MAG: hypothetical protein IH945_05025 [Armatimonadetes bacterium]|nr:hypothetical protein [Armatimonadota bacterium]